jgi:hypothetical protein
MMAGSHGPSGAFTIYRPPWEGFFKPPATAIKIDLDYELMKSSTLDLFGDSAQQHAESLSILNEQGLQYIPEFITQEIHDQLLAEIDR